MRQLITTLLLMIGLTTHGQESNFHSIDSIKTKETKENVESWLVGYWSFVEMRSPEGEKIDTIYHKKGDHFIGIEVIERTDYVFNPNRTYAHNPVLSSTDTVDPDSTQGTWYYDEEKKELILEYHEPIEPELSGLDEAYIEELKELGVFKPQTFNFLEIHSISNNELVIIEHRPHDEDELIYNLLIYRKIKNGE